MQVQKTFGLPQSRVLTACERSALGTLSDIQRLIGLGVGQPRPVPLQTEAGRKIKEVRTHVKDDHIDGLRVFERFDVDGNGSVLFVAMLSAAGISQPVHSSQFN